MRQAKTLCGGGFILHVSTDADGGDPALEFVEPDLEPGDVPEPLLYAGETSARIAAGFARITGRFPEAASEYIFEHEACSNNC